MCRINATALFVKIEISGSRSVPAEAVAYVRSADLCFVVYVSVLVMAVLKVLKAVSFAGATSHPYKAFGNIFVLMTAVFRGYGAFIFPTLITDLVVSRILAVRVAPT